jgi:hypothetical protein
MKVRKVDANILMDLSFVIIQTPVLVRKGKKFKNKRYIMVNIGKKNFMFKLDIYNYYRCPLCASVIPEDFRNWKYCPGCGTEINWEFDID